MSSQASVQAAPSTSYCFVLPWSFNHIGGVNEELANLIRQFTSDRACVPLLLDISWDADTSAEQPSGVTRLHRKLRPPYAARNPVISVLGFCRSLPRDLFVLRRMVQRHRIAVFNVHFPDLMAINFILLKLFRLFSGNVVLTFQGSDIREGHQQKGLLRWLWKFMLRHADVVVGCSDGLTEEALLLEPRAHAITIYNAIDVDFFAADAGPEFELPANLTGKQLILNIGSFQYRKGHDILLRAFRRVADQYPDTALLFAGATGPTGAPVRQLIAELHLQDQVHILENVPHRRIFNLLSRATLFAFASRWQKGVMGEGFALAVLEAAAAKVPIVSTASCGVSEIISDGVTGRMVPLEDSEAMASAICWMLANPAAARTMAENAYSLVRTRFTWAQAALQYKQLCTERPSN